MIYLFPHSAEIRVFGQNKGDHILKQGLGAKTRKHDKDMSKNKV